MVLDKGRIVEQGNFDALIQAKALFYRLAKHQLLV
jgi:ABC-type multidrug transport system fused ATPase/permease subunit